MEVHTNILAYISDKNLMMIHRLWIFELLISVQLHCTMHLGRYHSQKQFPIIFQAFTQFSPSGTTAPMSWKWGIYILKQVGLKYDKVWHLHLTYENI